MPLSEKEEYEYLLLKRKRANALALRSGEPRNIPQALAKGSRLPLEIGGAIGGGLVGSSLGPAGTFGGGALGYAGGKSLADLADRITGRKDPIPNVNEAVKETGENIYSGLENEALGLGTGAVLSPKNIKKLSKVVGQVSRVQSGNNPVDAARLMEDPGALFSKSVDKAGEILGNVRKKAGLVYKKSVDEITDPIGSVASKTVNDTFEWLDAGGKLDGPQLLRAKHALNALIERTPHKEEVRRSDLFDLKSTVDDLLSNLSGEEAKASREYSRSVLADKFKKILPVTKSGDVSLTRTLFLPAFDNKLADAGAVVLGLAQSPIISGAGISGLGFGIKAAKNPNVRRAIGAAGLGFTREERK